MTCGCGKIQPPSIRSPGPLPPNPGRDLVDLLGYPSPSSARPDTRDRRNVVLENSRVAAYSREQLEPRPVASDNDPGAVAAGGHEARTNVTTVRPLAEWWSPMRLLKVPLKSQPPGAPFQVQSPVYAQPRVDRSNPQPWDVNYAVGIVG